MEKKKKLVLLFSRIAIAEGISFLVLLCIAMPLKYFAGLPDAVQFVGWAHGVLFVAFLVLALMVAIQLKKNFLWLVGAFFASILPFGTFVFERRMNRAAN